MRKRKFSLEFKREAVRLVRDSGNSITQVARELGLGTSLLAKWIKELEPAKASGDLTPEEQEELKALRKENARLKMEVEILGKAAAYSTGHRNTTTSDSWLKKVVTHAGSQTRLVPKREG